MILVKKKANILCFGLANNRFHHAIIWNEYTYGCLGVIQWIWQYLLTE